MTGKDSESVNAARSCNQLQETSVMDERLMETTTMKEELEMERHREAKARVG